MCLSLLGLLLVSAAGACDPGGAPAAKRVPPPDVAPVTIGGVTFKAIHWGKERGLEQNGGYIAAVDPETGEELWILKVYDVKYDPELEEDVQDVFIETMSKTFWRGRLKIEDERGGCRIVDPETREIGPC